MSIYSLTLKQEVLKELAAYLQSIFCRNKLDGAWFDENTYKKVIELDDEILLTKTEGELLYIERELLKIKNFLEEQEIKEYAV